MPEVTTPYATGTPCWVELRSKDQQASLDFYRELLGWQGKPGPDELGGLAVCELNGKAVAGIVPLTASDATGWTTCLASTDADATQKAITAAGGTILIPAVDVGDRGRALLAADPQGAVFGVWQPGTLSGMQVVHEAGAQTWSELHTSDESAAASFYGKVFGIKVNKVHDTYWELRVDGHYPFASTHPLSLDAPGTPAHWQTYFAVDDVDSTVATLGKHGGTVLFPPVNGGFGRVALVADPQGARFGVMKRQPRR
ncbi:VOC family protein [Streptomyces venezuelae]|uniref:VOC family protein n=1 Tax=Streptomyces venezuelae TaxID=54571 RepID=UPI00278BE06B|nr:VOC family protein [Streptomyces venezuelae]